ncbi:carboxylating nicotinate-nucleotide diphosphorylase [Corynebacterium bovis]|uniref:Nicotinate-nucleotide pyrophosphorylase [carboxylating] n=1 Tax=Corynebacterium bovis TaxID=36808 RepID=A0A426Q6H6_9CORY|nr:carboxylating nicotinate-nucleotide diphosphorylase [Corynebacterium bovis]RRO92886.1 nicotinate-nucleotide diphosphorylase (carboxylating) [Corynebacterium bovis]RRO99638.1 nicotinate-nucleotide diphosphorylase (carboxylating) [Corynebacterium bovis]RRQ00976.1 nicotinate-nucleotide diphosphorylase (carboxylating) [Corynebacterium bovis]RRQ05026.1 nicotinate-nucleotide diphosphorylase (carboxylating) [Corynebacterium bovis]RRQ06936.1 nicotinate-nucleotide diphosphorylase (carboxylating) [Co
MAVDPRFPATPALHDPARVREDHRRLAATALAEDLGDPGPHGAPADPTSAAVPDVHVTGDVVVREAGVVSGLDAAAVVAELTGATFTPLCADGDPVTPGTTVARIDGDAVTVLRTERTALNILSHASGVATRTAAWVAAVAVPGARVAVRDTRKTLPGMRLLQKRAVVHGGGTPHRYGLTDQAMVKDNHVLAAGGVLDAWRRVRDAHPDVWCEVEVDDLDQLRDVLAHGPRQVLLDNFDVADTRRAVAERDRLCPSCLLESSGGLTLDRAADYAACGIDSVAVGELTHSVRALDIGLDLRPVDPASR